MRNSLVNTAFIEGRLKRFRGFNLRSNVKAEVNFQQETPLQKANRIGNWTAVVAADYVWRRGRWTVRPQMKYMAQRIDDQKDVVRPVFETFLYPILRIDCTLTPSTVIKSGVQGPSWYHNVINDSADYTSEDYIAMVTNTSSYSGYELSFNAGYQLKRRRMADRSRESEDIDYSLFFIRLIAGLRPSEAR